MIASDEEIIKAICFCVDKEVEDYGYKYIIDDLCVDEDTAYAYINFTYPDNLELHIKVSKVIKSKHDADEYDCVFEVDMGSDSYEVCEWWQSSAKYFWMAILS